MIKVSEKILDEAEGELEREDYFSYLHQHFQRRYPGLFCLIWDSQLALEKKLNQRGVSCPDIKDFFLFLLRLLEKEGEKKNIRLPKIIDQEVINTAVIDLINERWISNKGLENLFKDNPVLISGLIYFATQGLTKDEEKGILGLGIVLLKLIQAQQEVHQLKEDLKGDE